MRIHLKIHLFKKNPRKLINYAKPNLKATLPSFPSALKFLKEAWKGA